MTKAKFKSPGIIKVTMTDDQYLAIAAILQHVRLGGGNYLTHGVIDYIDDLGPFNCEHLFDDKISEIAGEIEFIYNQRTGVSIVLNAEEE